MSVIGTEQGLSELLRSYITKTSLVFEGWIEKPEAGEHSELRVQPLEDFGLVDEARARAEGCSTSIQSGFLMTIVVCSERSSVTTSPGRVHDKDPAEAERRPKSRQGFQSGR